MKKKVEIYTTCGKFFMTLEGALDYVSESHTGTGIRDGLGQVREANWANGLKQVESGTYKPLPVNPKTPRSYNLQSYMPKVYDQASRGTCAANAATALMEYYHGGKHRFSVQYLYERMKRAERDAYREAAVEIINDKTVSDPDIREYARNIRSNGESEADLAVHLYNKRIEMDGGSTAKYVFKVLEKYGICTYDIWPYAREQLDRLDLVTDANNRYLPDGADDDAKRFRLNDKYYLFPSPNNVEEIKNYLCGLRYKPMPVYVGVRLFSGPDGKTLSEEGGIARLPKIVDVEITKVCGEIDTDAVKKTFSVISTDPDTVETV